jgi:transposase
MNELTTIGLALAENVFQVNGVEAASATVLRKRVPRSQVLGFFARVPRCLVGMEVVDREGRERIEDFGDHAGHDSRAVTVPGVGPVVAMTFRATIDQPARFAKSKAVGAHFGLTPHRYQSGEMDYSGRIFKCGDRMMRAALYEAAQALLTRVQKW